MQETLLSALRRATSARHAHIEKLLRLDAPFGLDHYARVLRGFDSFLAQWEPGVRAALPRRLHDWFDARSRVPLLQRDLRALGIASPQADAIRAMPAPGQAALQDCAAAFGSLYVVEGSVLGGRVVARQLAAQHGLDEKSGAAYFTGWGARTGAMWQEFLRMLESLDAQGIDPAPACRAACETFDALSQHCARSLDAAR